MAGRANLPATQCIVYSRAKTNIYIYIDVSITMQFVFIPSLVREGSTFLVVTGVQFFQTELEPVGRVSAVQGRAPNTRKGNAML